MDLTNASAIVTGGRGDFARWPNFLEPPQPEVGVEPRYVQNSATSCSI